MEKFGAFIAQIGNNHHRHQRHPRFVLIFIHSQYEANHYTCQSKQIGHVWHWLKPLKAAVKIYIMCALRTHIKQLKACIQL